jgi:hypothetical protein
MNIKVFQYVQMAFCVEDAVCFQELAHKIKTNNAEETGLDLLCHGQEHFDTLSLLMNEDNDSEEYD